MVIFAENLNGPFFGIGAADVDAGFDTKVGVPVGFLPGMAQDAGEQAYRRFEDRLPALIINACLDAGTLEVGVGVEGRPVLTYRSLFRAILFQRQGSGSIQNVFPDPCPHALIAR